MSILKSAIIASLTLFFSRLGIDWFISNLFDFRDILNHYGCLGGGTRIDNSKLMVACLSAMGVVSLAMYSADGLAKLVFRFVAKKMKPIYG